MSSPFKNILVVGAAGSIGSLVLNGLLAEPTLTVTALQRASSKSKLSSGVKVITIDDSYPTKDLISAFEGHDAIVNCMTSLVVGDQLRFVDAAVAAGVRRYVASEYGLNNNRPEARALNSVFRDKGEVQDYLRSKESTGLEWMAIACGMWLEWSATHGFLGMHIKDKRFVFWDDGDGYFSATTEANTVQALVSALTKKWRETRNRVVWLSDFAITQKQLLDTIERISGDKYTTERIDSEAHIREKKAAVEAGDVYAAYALIETGFVTGRFGGHLEKEGEIMNQLLELPKTNLDDVVKAALEAVRSSG